MNRYVVALTLSLQLVYWCDLALANEQVSLVMDVWLSGNAGSGYDLHAKLTNESSQQILFGCYVPWGIDGEATWFRAITAETREELHPNLIRVRLDRSRAPCKKRMVQPKVESEGVNNLTKLYPALSSEIKKQGVVVEWWCPPIPHLRCREGSGGYVTFPKDGSAPQVISTLSPAGILEQLRNLFKGLPQSNYLDPDYVRALSK